MDSDYGIPRELSDLQKLRASYQPQLPPCLQVLALLPTEFPALLVVPWFLNPCADVLFPIVPDAVACCLVGEDFVFPVLRVDLILESVKY